jgi:hypothetical protein
MTRSGRGNSVQFSPPASLADRLRTSRHVVGSGSYTAKGS